MQEGAHKKTIIFYGMSGAGKGTQAHLLKDYWEQKGEPVLYIETGDRLRKFIQGSGHTEEITKKTMNEGGLLPSFLPIHVWTTAFVEEFTGREHVIMDGLARRHYEAPTLDGALWFYGRGDYEIVVLEISHEAARERLMSRHRGDDLAFEAIHRKLLWYQSNTEQAIEFFETSGRVVHRVDGMRPIEIIHKDIRERLGLES